MTERCGWMLQCVKSVGHDGQHEVTSLRTLNPPADTPAAEKVTPELLAAHAADLAAGRHDLNGAYGCSICGTSPSEPAAPAPDFFADHSDAEVQAALDDVRGKAPAQGAEARIAELEKERDHWRSACIEGMVTGKYPVSPHDDDPQIKSLREAAEASFHGQAYAEMAKRARKAEEALAAARRECDLQAVTLCDTNKELALARQASLEHWIREKQLCQAIENLLIDDDERWLERQVAAQALLDGAR